LEIAGYRGVFDRRFAGKQSAPEFVRKVDDLMRQGRVLKDDRASFISRVLWNGHDAVIKRYNHRNLWHSLRHTVKGSRARRNWLSAHQLMSLEIATPEPLAYVDQYRGPLLWQSYFVARFVPGPQVHEILHDETVVESQKQRINDMVLTLLREMAQHGVSHGDMKHTNILYDGTGVVLTDLDAMRIGGAGWLRRHRYRRDVDRYLRDLRR
jgi:tRNA A-37 threonylcarbamoyl transferase component Bud32